MASPAKIKLNLMEKTKKSTSIAGATIKSIFLAVFVSTIALQVILPIASAKAVTDPKSLPRFEQLLRQQNGGLERAIQWSKARAAVWCIENEAINVDTEKAVSGAWFGDGDSAFNSGDKVSIGHHVYDGDGDDGGRVKCSNKDIPWWGSTLDFYGYSGTRTVAASKVYDLSGDLYKKTDQSPNKLRDLISVDLFGGSGKFPPQAPDDAAYFAYLENFQKGCNAENLGASPTPDIKTNYNDIYAVKVIENGKVITVQYGTKAAKKDRISTGYGLPNDASNDGVFTCDELGQILGQEKWPTAVLTAIANYETLTGTKTNGAATSSLNPTDLKDPGAGICENAVPVLGWILCPLFEAADKLQGTFTNMLKSLLYINPQYFDSAALKAAWVSFRNISTILLVLIALLMVVSQILSLGVFDAYTVKKIVPRLFIAAIIIQLSWFLTTLLITIANGTAAAIAEIIYAPFGGAVKVDNITAVISQFKDVNGGLAAAGSERLLTGMLVGVGAAAIGGAFPILATILIVVISVLTALVTLIIRQILIVACVILAPVAIVLWILPGTQNLFKLWWNLFIKLLLMAPLIVALIASGKAFAYLVASINTSDSTFNSGTLNFFVILVAYFGPLFLLPATFKFAGGIFAQASNAINGVGNKVKASDPGNLKKNFERRKAASDQQKDANRNKDLNSENSFKRTNARLRSGTLGLSKRTASYRNDLLESGLDTGTAAGNRVLISSGFDANDAKYFDSSGNAILDKSDAYVAIAQGKKIFVDVPGKPRTELDGTDYGLQSAVINNAASQPDISAYDAIIERGGSGAQVLVARATGRNAGTLNPKRPDIVQGESAFEKLGGTGMGSLHKTGARELNEYLGRLESNDPAKYETVVSSLGASLVEMVDNPQARALASANPAALEVYKATLEPHLMSIPGPNGNAGITVLRDRINSDGTLVS